MKRIIPLLMALICLTACNDYETYGDKKEKERDAINSFISQQGITRISEATFHQNGNTTDTARNEFVYMENSGVYMQIVRKGCGRPIQDGENAFLEIRFYEQGLLSLDTMRNDVHALIYNPDVMNLSCTGSNYTASFSSGFMYSRYGASVPAGWLVPFSYINLDGPTLTDDIAKVRLIVPHSQGHSVASSNVYPYYYEITYQRQE